MNELHKGQRKSSLDAMRQVLARLDSYVSETDLLPSPVNDDATFLGQSADNRVTNASAFHHSLMSLVHNSPDAVLLL